MSDKEKEISLEDAINYQEEIKEYIKLLCIAYETNEYDFSELKRRDNLLKKRIKKVYPEYEYDFTITKDIIALFKKSSSEYKLLIAVLGKFTATKHLSYTRMKKIEVNEGLHLGQKYILGSIATGLKMKTREFVADVTTQHYNTLQVKSEFDKKLILNGSLINYYLPELGGTDFVTFLKLLKSYKEDIELISVKGGTIRSIVSKGIIVKDVKKDSIYFAKSLNDGKKNSFKIINVDYSRFNNKKGHYEFEVIRSTNLYRLNKIECIEVLGKLDFNYLISENILNKTIDEKIKDFIITDNKDFSDEDYGFKTTE